MPCGDGTCQSDYISCLRALTELKKRHAADSHQQGGGGGGGGGGGAGGASSSSLSVSSVVAAMPRGVQEMLKTSEWQYGENGLKFEEQN